MGPSKQFDPERIIDLWNEGLEMGEISSRLGCSEGYVNAIICKARKERGSEAVLLAYDSSRVLRWSAYPSKHDWCFRLDSLVSSRVRIIA